MSSDAILRASATWSKIQVVEITQKFAAPGAGLKDVRTHDLRHTFASTAVASGQGLPMIGKRLGHTQVQTTARLSLRSGGLLQRKSG